MKWWIYRKICISSIGWTINYNICKVDKTTKWLNSLCLSVCYNINSFFSKAYFKLTIEWIKHVKPTYLDYVFSAFQNHITKTFIHFGHFLFLVLNTIEKLWKFEEFSKWIQIQNNLGMVLQVFSWRYPSVSSQVVTLG